MDNPGRSFESYAFRVILLVTAVYCATRAYQGSGWYLWIVAPGLLIWALVGCDFDRVWEWWIYFLLCTYFAGHMLFGLLTLGSGSPGGTRAMLAVFAGVGIAAAGVLVSGRLRRVWTFARRGKPPV